MPHRDHTVFLSAIERRRMLHVRFFSQEDAKVLSRYCAPMDFGPSKRFGDGIDRYHFFNFTSDKKPHSMMILPENIEAMTEAEELFDPASFVTWNTGKNPWIVSRDWGEQS